MTNSTTIIESFENQLDSLISNIESDRAEMNFSPMNFREKRSIGHYISTLRNSFPIKLNEFFNSIEGDFIQEDISIYYSGYEVRMNLVVWTKVDGKIVRNSLNVPQGSIIRPHYRIQNRIVKSIKK